MHRVIQFVDWFLSGYSRTDAILSEAELARARLVVGLLLVWLATAVFFSFYMAITLGFSFVFVVCVTSVFLWASVLAYLRRTGDVVSAGTVLCVGLLIMVIASAVALGGVVTLMSPWGIIPALLATYVIGLRAGIALGVATFGTGLVLAVLQIAGWWTLDEWVVAYAFDPLNALLTGSIAFGIVLLVGALYAAAQRQAREKLERNFERLHRSREALAQSEKMAAVGRFAGGMAHEINNPLSVILAFSEGIQSRLADSDPTQERLDAVVRETLRCKTLIGELLEFARTGSVEPRQVAQVDLNDVVTSTMVLLEVRSGERGVAVTCDLVDGLPTIVGCREQLQRLIVNLGENAIDASPVGGTITLRTRSNGPKMVVLEVRDAGSGIPPEIEDRIFEPFFTTKDPGKGTGLGLSLVYEIAQQHGATVSVDSDLAGTTLSLHLPV